MATRALIDLKNALLKHYAITSGTTLAVGNRVKFGAADTTVDLSGSNDDTAFGTVVIGGVGIADLSVKCQVVLDGHCIVPMLVGTGGSTRGVKQIQVADGITDAATNGGGTTPHTVVGIAMQSGVALDVIGVMPLPGRCVTV